jgi:tRNA A-37 threonylcarbamoyl transferase component Bud32
MKKRHPRTLSSGANNTVIALSDTEVGKIFVGDTRSDIGSEAEKMKFANAVNGLVVKFVRLDEFGEEGEMLVMERLFPLDFRAFEYEKRELLLDVFEDELTQLHKAGFVHRDLRRPSDMPGLTFDNIFLTQQGIRLIDVGISALIHQVGDRLFQRFVTQEKQEFEQFRSFFLSR